MTSKLLNELKGAIPMRLFAVTLKVDDVQWIEVVRAFDTLGAIRKAKTNAECPACVCVECRIVFESLGQLKGIHTP